MSEDPTFLRIINIRKNSEQSRTPKFAELRKPFDVELWSILVVELDLLLLLLLMMATLPLLLLLLKELLERVEVEGMSFFESLSFLGTRHTILAFDDAVNIVHPPLLRVPEDAFCLEHLGVDFFCVFVLRSVWVPLLGQPSERLVHLLLRRALVDAEGCVEIFRRSARCSSTEREKCVGKFLGCDETEDEDEDEDEKK